MMKRYKNIWADAGRALLVAVAFSLGMVFNHFGEDRIIRTVEVYNDPKPDEAYRTTPKDTVHHFELIPTKQNKSQYRSVET